MNIGEHEVNANMNPDNLQLAIIAMAVIGGAILVGAFRSRWIRASRRRIQCTYYVAIIWMLIIMALYALRIAARFDLI